MPGDDRRTSGQHIAHELFRLLMASGSGHTMEEVLSGLRLRGVLAVERREDEERVVKSSLNDYVAAGMTWRSERQWIITSAGRAAYEVYPDAKSFQTEVRRRRRVFSQLDFGRPAFEALCDLASRESWCWKIGCTTCLCMYFRYGLLELAYGKHPDTREWITRQCHQHDFQQYLGPLPNGYSLQMQHALVKAFSQGSVDQIAIRCPFPDWLGYLGLALYFTESVEQRDKTLIVTWAPQLIEMLPANCAARYACEALLHGTANDGRVLRWRMLEDIETERSVGARDRTRLTSRLFGEHRI